MYRRKIFRRKLWQTSQRYQHKRPSAIQSFEKSLFRAILLGTVLLVLFQFGSSTDPVDFYLRVSGDIDAPAFKYEEYIEDQGKPDQVRLSFRSEPEASVQIKQNGEMLGIVGEGIEVVVQKGTVELDATHIPYPVTVTIKWNQQDHQIQLNQDVKSFQVYVKTNS